MAIPSKPGWFLKEWREHRGLTFEQLAERVESSPGYVSDLEKGKRRFNSEHLELFALALNTTPADLIRRRPNDPEAIEVGGLAPDQVNLVRGMVEQLRRTGTDG